MHNFNIKNHKGNVVVYILAGIAIFLALGLFFYIRINSKKNTETKNLPEAFVQTNPEAQVVSSNPEKFTFEGVTQINKLDKNGYLVELFEGYVHSGLFVVPALNQEIYEKDKLNMITDYNPANLAGYVLNGYDLYYVQQAKDDKGTLSKQTIIKADLKTFKAKKIFTKSYDLNSNEQNGAIRDLYFLNNKLYFIINKDIFKYDQQTEKVEQIATTNSNENLNNKFVGDKNGIIYLDYDNGHFPVHFQAGIGPIEGLVVLNALDTNTNKVFIYTKTPEGLNYNFYNVDYVYSSKDHTFETKDCFIPRVDEGKISLEKISCEELKNNSYHGVISKKYEDGYKGVIRVVKDSLPIYEPK